MKTYKFQGADEYEQIAKEQGKSAAQYIKDCMEKIHSKMGQKAEEDENIMIFRDYWTAWKLAVTAGELVISQELLTRIDELFIQEEPAESIYDEFLKMPDFKPENFMSYLREEKELIAREQTNSKQQEHA
jgi:hypothetical protein